MNGFFKKMTIKDWFGLFVGVVIIIAAGGVTVNTVWANRILIQETRAEVDTLNNSVIRLEQSNLDYKESVDGFMTKLIETLQRDGFYNGGDTS